MNKTILVILPSDASLDKAPKNTIGSYVTWLDEPLLLEGEWEVALLDITYPSQWEIRHNAENSKPEGLCQLSVVCQGLVEPGYWGNNKHPFLRQFVPGPRTTHGLEERYRDFNSLMFIPVQKGLSRVDSVNIDILDELGQPVLFTGGKVSCTLQFQKLSNG